MKIINKKKFKIRIIELIITVITIIVTIFAINYANKIRGYSAFGGEYLLPFIGFYIIMLIESLLKEDIQNKAKDYDEVFYAEEQLEELKQIIKRKNREIVDIKNSIADVLSSIRELNECNDYGDPSVKRRRISELCTDTRYELLLDEEDNKKIVELSTTNHSNDNSTN